MNFKFSVSLLFLAMTIFTDSSLAQTQNSRDGAECSMTRHGVIYRAYAESQFEAATAVCAQRNAPFQNGVCQFNNATSSVGCGSVAVCLTGNGYEPADISGFCPDPISGDDDDKDGDGSNCDAGEEATSDCFCDDGSAIDIGGSCPEDNSEPDSDGDGEPDSEDNDDGRCDKDNLGDADCDGTCDASDEADSSDCPSGEENCGTGGDDDFFGDFNISISPFSPPALVCAENKCQYSNPRNCVEKLSDTNFVACLYTSDGASCEGCDLPSCTQTLCPEGSSQNETGSCVDTPQFCTLDEEDNETGEPVPDGIPDHQGTFACSSDNSSDGILGNDQIDCDAPPQCPSEADQIACAINLQSFKDFCGTQFENPINCEEEFVCTGDPYECQVLTYERASFCSTQLTDEQKEDPSNLLVFREGVDDGTSWFGEGGEGNFIDVGDALPDLDDSGYGWGSQCFQDYSFNYDGETYTIEVSRLCPILDVIGYMIMILASIVSFRIVQEAF